ncbi:hypothetical protein BGX38DRAFT_409760 [Terfezia claveryi]|nr:hypothetical protein BGX38DRAFT_409760 [Terfezia claveryi]
MNCLTELLGDQVEQIQQIYIYMHPIPIGAWRNAWQLTHFFTSSILFHRIPSHCCDPAILSTLRQSRFCRTLRQSRFCRTLRQSRFCRTLRHLCSLQSRLYPLPLQCLTTFSTALGVLDSARICRSKDEGIILRHRTPGHIIIGCPTKLKFTPTSEGFKLKFTPTPE